MKLLRYGCFGEEKVGLLDTQGMIRDLSHYIYDLTPEVLGDPTLITQLKALNVDHLPKVEGNPRLGACVAKPGKIVCVGFNCVQHVKEMGHQPLMPEEMMIFLKSSSSLCGPDDPILYAPGMQKLDWEAELAFVIGRQGKYISKEDARSYILGYTAMNDLSERSWQFGTADRQFTRGKCFDHAAPLGPCLVTSDVWDPESPVSLRLWVNGTLRQSFTSDIYLHDEAAIIHEVSQYFTLYPGDIISMGSGPGNAAAWREAYLKPGDDVVFSIEGIGTQHQKVCHEHAI